MQYVIVISGKENPIPITKVIRLKFELSWTLQYIGIHQKSEIYHHKSYCFFPSSYHEHTLLCPVRMHIKLSN